MIQEKQLIENSNATFIQITISKLINVCITYVAISLKFSLRLILLSSLYIIIIMMMYNNYNFLV